MHARRILTAVSALAFLVLALAPAASAHASANSSDGKIKITWGWQNEPAYAGEKVGIDLIIRDNATNAGIGGIAAANITELSLHYGDDEFELGNLTAYTGVKGSGFAGPGNYTAAKKFYLTKAGIYVLHVKGTIAGSEVDVEIPTAHPTESLDDIAFPAEDASDLEARIATLEAEVAALKAQAKTQSETPATLTPVGTTNAAGPDPIPSIGLLALCVGIVAAALIVRRK